MQYWPTRNPSSSFVWLEDLLHLSKRWFFGIILGAICPFRKIAVKKPIFCNIGQIISYGMINELANIMTMQMVLTSETTIDMRRWLYMGARRAFAGTSCSGSVYQSHSHHGFVRVAKNEKVSYLICTHFSTAIFIWSVNTLIETIAYRCLNVIDQWHINFVAFTFYSLCTCIISILVYPNGLKAGCNTSRGN